MRHLLSSSECSVLNHIHIARSAVLAVVQFVDSSSIQLQDTAVRVNMPLSSIQVLLQEDGVAQWARHLVICDQASKSVYSSNHASDLVAVVFHHDRHHIC